MQANLIARGLLRRASGLAVSLSGKAARQGGISLIEVLVAMVIAGGAVVVFLSGLSTASKAGAIVWERTIAEGLAQSQVEYVKGQAYIVVPGAYDVISPVPDGFTVLTETAAVAGRDEDIQKITVTIYRGEERLLIRQALKVNR